MAKKEFRIYWNREKRSLNIVDQESIFDDFQVFPTGYYDGQMSHEKKHKTDPQFGYFWGEIARKALRGYNRLGYNLKDKEMAVEVMKMEEEIDFTEKITDPFTGHLMARIAKRISSDETGRAEFAQLTNDCYHFVLLKLEEDVLTPEEYKQKQLEARKNANNKGSD